MCGKTVGISKPLGNQHSEKIAQVFQVKMFLFSFLVSPLKNLDCIISSQVPRRTEFQNCPKKEDSIIFNSHHY